MFIAKPDAPFGLPLNADQWMYAFTTLIAAAIFLIDPGLDRRVTDYFYDAGTRKFLADLAGLVVPGGTLILDYGFVAEALLPGLALEEPPMTFGGVEAVSVNEYDSANSRWITAFTFRRGAVEHHGTSVQHVYTAAEVVRLVTAAGFVRAELYGGTDASPFRLGSPRLLLVARRPR